MRHATMILGAVSMLGLAACGGEGDEARAFVGTWQPTSGTVTVTCPGYLAETTPVTANMSWSAGVSSDIVGIEAGSPCTLMADVAGMTASALPGQNCMGPTADGSFSITFSGYTFVLGPGGNTATENGSGTVTFIVEGASISCAFSQTAAYQKISN